MGTYQVNWKFWGDVVYTVATAEIWLFVLVYGLGAPWYRYEGGRNIFGMMAAMAVILTYFGWAIWAGGVPAAVYPTRALLFTGLAYFVGRRVIILLQRQLLARNQKGNPHVEDSR